MGWGCHHAMQGKLRHIFVSVPHQKPRSISMAISGNVDFRSKLAHVWCPTVLPHQMQLGICRFNLLVECEMQYVALQCATNTGIPASSFSRISHDIKIFQCISFVLSKQVVSQSNSTTSQLWETGLQ